MDFIKRKDIQRNLEVLFVFGDNDERKGMGGMAKEFRGEPNAIGIRTKKKPQTGKDVYYTDEEYTENTKKIDEDIATIKQEAKKYSAIWYTENIGAGLAKLDTDAPKTFAYLQKQLESLNAIYSRTRKP